MTDDNTSYSDKVSIPVDHLSNLVRNNNEVEKETVVREGSRTKLDAATEITVAALPYLFFGGLIYLGLGLLGFVPLPTFGIEFTVKNILIAAGSITGFTVFAVVGYLAIKFHRDPDYVHAVTVDSAGRIFDSETMTPQRWRQLEVRDDQGNLPPSRETSGGDTAYLCREVNMDDNFVKPAGDLQDAPDDDQIISDKAQLKVWRQTLADDANNWQKLRGLLPAIKHQISKDNVNDMAVSFEQSEHGGEKVEEWLETVLDDYDATISDQDEQPTKQQQDPVIDDLLDQASKEEGDADE